MQKVLAEDPSAAVRIKEKPENAYWPEWAGMYATALELLSGERPALPFGGFGHIPFSAYDRYARRYEITGSDFDIFCYIMGRLDAVCLRSMNKQKG